MKYYNYTNKELLNAYNANGTYNSEMCEEICSRVGMHEDYYLANDKNLDRVVEEAIKQLETYN